MTKSPRQLQRFLLLIRLTHPVNKWWYLHHQNTLLLMVPQGGVCILQGVAELWSPLIGLTCNTSLGYESILPLSTLSSLFCMNKYLCTDYCFKYLFHQAVVSYFPWGGVTYISGYVTWACGEFERGHFGLLLLSSINKHDNHKYKTLNCLTPQELLVAKLQYSTRTTYKPWKNAKD